MFRAGSLRLGSIKSIEINVNVTWLVVFGLLVYWLRNGYVIEKAPDLGPITSWVVSAVGALVLFASVLTHELSHSLVALKNGLPIRRITLFIFGGVAHMEKEPATPGVEFRMAIAGPVASLAIATVFAFLRFVVFKGNPGTAPWLIAEYAAYANMVLAGFNLVPGYPLDGGRVLRAILWKLTGSFVKATTIAATIGRVFGLGLVFVGVTLSVALKAPAFLWPAFIGTFLERLAYMSARRARMMLGRRQVEEVPAARVVSMTPYPQYHSDSDGWNANN
ncbi:MAG: site-2 protease family protein [Candidatus Eisenbacteria bacterium]